MLIEQLESIRERFEEVTQQITMPEVVSDMDKFKKISKEYPTEVRYNYFK